MNDKPQILIIGCGAGGGTAAQFARKTQRNAHITIFEQGPYPQYSKCGLPYILSGEILNIENLIEFTSEWFHQQKINLLLNTMVTTIDINKKTIITENKNGHATHSFDKIILATGANPVIPPIKNIQHQDKLIDGIYTVRTIDDIRKIQNKVHKNKNAVIIGGGLIGLEIADSLHKKHLNVTVVEALPNILTNTLDNDFSTSVLTHITNSIKVYTNHLATEIKTTNNKISEVLIQNQTNKKQHHLPADILIIATGSKPQTKLAQQINCTIGPTGGIKISNTAETSVKNVYAVGDCTEYVDFITNKPLLMGLGSIAVRQGITAGINTAGGTYTLPKGVLLTRTSELFNLEIAGVGPTHNQLQNNDVITGKIKGSTKPSYFPGGQPIHIKIIADQTTGTILGAQAIGTNAAQRINTYAAAIMKHTTVDELKTLETAYAPPIAPTLDATTLVCDIVATKRNRKRIT